MFNSSNRKDQELAIIISNCRGFVNGHHKVSINLVIQFQECLLGFIIETIDTDLNCLCLVVEDAVCLYDVNQAASGDDLLNTTIIEGLTDNVTPINKSLTKLIIFDVKSCSKTCLLYTSPSPRDMRRSRMPSSA